MSADIPLNPFADEPDNDHDKADAAYNSTNCSNDLHQCCRIV